MVVTREPRSALVETAPCLVVLLCVLMTNLVPLLVHIFGVRLRTDVLCGPCHFPPFFVFDLLPRTSRSRTVAITRWTSGSGGCTHPKCHVPPVSQISHVLQVSNDDDSVNLSRKCASFQRELVHACVKTSKSVNFFMPWDCSMSTCAHSVYYAHWDSFRVSCCLLLLFTFNSSGNAWEHSDLTPSWYACGPCHLLALCFWWLDGAFSCTCIHGRIDAPLETHSNGSSFQKNVWERMGTRGAYLRWSSTRMWTSLARPNTCLGMPTMTRANSCDESDSPCEPHCASKPLDLDYVLYDSPSVPPNLPSTPQSSKRPYLNTNTAQSSWVFRTHVFRQQDERRKQHRRSR